MEDIEFDEEYELLWMISAYRGTIEIMLRGSEDLAKLLSNLTTHPLGKAIIDGKDVHLPPVITLLEDLWNFIGKEDPLKRILSVEDNVLGAYFFASGGQAPLFGIDDRWSRIELYWCVIGLFARSLGVTTEALTVVVLTHELAHAYTHLGMDTDRKRWSTGSYARAEKPLKEGLAQYYTYLVSRSLIERIPDLYTAYEKLLKNQPPAYHTHEGWIEGYNEEEIRSALVNVRRRELLGLDDFIESLEDAHHRMGRNHLLETSRTVGTTG
jgi:hypothetical protein